MSNKTFAIIEIGSNNTKIHIYKDERIIYEKNVTIEFKKNYQLEKKISENNMNKLFEIIEKTLAHTKDIHIYGCSIFRNITSLELNGINERLKNKFNLEIEVVSQEDEAKFTALGCYNNINYKGPICIFIGGGGSVELIFVDDKKVIEKKYYDFGVVDITKEFPSLKDDIPTCTFDEVYHYVEGLIDDIEISTDILILAGGDHFYWYNNAGYELSENTLYQSVNQRYMITREMSDRYDRDAYITSLDTIRRNSDNPVWFDGSRAMKAITNLISHKVNAKYIIPTKINMEDGLKDVLRGKDE